MLVGLNELSSKGWLDEVQLKELTRLAKLDLLVKLVEFDQITWKIIC